VELLRNNEPVLASEQLTEILKSVPGEVNSMRMLGVSLVLQGRLDEAITQLQAVIHKVPDFAMAYDDLGGALAAAGNFEEAEKSLRRALKLDPKLTNAWQRLGDLLVKQGRGEEADAAYRHVLKSDPVREMLAEAKEHLVKGHIFKAEDLYKEILKQDPRNSEAYGALATIAMRSGVFRDAERLLTHSLKQDPKVFQNWGLLGHVLRKQDKLEESIDAINKGIEIDSNSEILWSSLGASLSQLLDTEKALDAFQRSLEIEPDQPGVILSIGHVRNTMGDNESAIECYRQCLDDEVHRGTAYWYLSNLKTYSFSDDEIREMDAVLEVTEPEDEGYSPLNFALGKAAEDASDYDQAFSYYAEGNKKKSDSQNYKPEVIEQETDRMIKVFDEEFFARTEGWGCQDAAPVFILGLPRSGSTLQEQILASHSVVDGTMELHHVIRTMRMLDERDDGDDQYPEIVTELDADEYRQLGENFIADTLKYRGDAPHFIDKMPNNFRHIGLIHLMLPKAKIIDARRHPMDACFGCFKQNFAFGQQFTYSLEHMARYYINYVRLMDHWDKVLPGKVLRVQYEDVISDTETQVRRVLEHCELPFEENCLRFYETKRAVRTPSAEQVRQPIYSKGVGYWRNFESHLGALKKALEPIADRYPLN
jgi:tetratricopeptide (TPR) repeat protein